MSQLVKSTGIITPLNYSEDRESSLIMRTIVNALSLGLCLTRRPLSSCKNPSDIIICSTHELKISMSTHELRWSQNC